MIVHKFSGLNIHVSKKAPSSQFMTGWCSWLSHPPDIAAMQHETAGGPEFEPRISHDFFENKSGFPSLG
jgi:hypothetical protein